MERSTETPFDNLIGQMVANRFRVESVLGVGAMGVVFRARAEDEPPVALKVVLPERGQQRVVPRFLRGTRLAAQLRHPHVVETLAYGPVGPAREGYFVAMELVEGVPLSRLTSAKLDVGVICALMCQVLDALAFMHARGILHRDIKPDNILVSRDHSGVLVCKISDFGIAAETRQDATMLTQPGMVVGTPLYMAPEQMSGRGLDTPAIDLYSVGAILYEMLSGALPFAGQGMSAVMAKLVEDAPALAPRPGLAVPPGLVDVVMRLVARQPQDRYLLAADARAALERFAAPARVPGETWQDLSSWQPQVWEPGELPAGWSDGPPALAAGTDDHGPAVFGAAGAGAGELPLVGRDALLERIEGVAGEVEAGQGRTVLIQGATGMGKSALLDEVVMRLSGSGRFQVVRVPVPPTLGFTEGLRQAVDSALGTSERSTGQVRQVVDDLLRRHGEHEQQEAQDLVGFLRPGGGAGIEQGAAFAITHRCLRRLSRARPVLLVIDDVHRGGADALAFLEFLLFQAGFEPVPLLAVATVAEICARSAFQMLLGRMGRHDGTALHRLSLTPLDEEVLASALSGHLKVTLPRARSIARRAAGNPLFALHMARAVSEEVATGDSATVVVGRVPRALHELLELSLSQGLARTSDPDRHRELLEAVAVLGPTVDTSLLEAFLDGEVPPGQLDRMLDACLDMGLLVWNEVCCKEVVGLVPEVLRDVLLEDINPRRARRLHRRAIEVRTRWAGARVDAHAGALGDHCEAAGQPDEAVDWWLRGQRHEMNGGNLLLGVEWGLRALAAMAPGDARRSPCAIAVGRTLLDIGDLERAAEVLRPVVAGADADLAMRAGEVLGDVYENLDRDDEWTALIEQLAAREHEASPEGRVSLYLARSLWMNNHTRVQEGERDALKALEGASQGEQTQRAAQRLAFSHLFRHDLTGALEMARQAYAASGDRSDLRARSLRVLALTAMALGQLEEARAHLNLLLDISRRSGMLARIPLALRDLGEVARAEGKLTEAREMFASAGRTARDLGLASTLRSVEVCNIVTDLQEGKSEGVLSRVHALSARATDNTGYIARLCLMLEALVHAIEGRVDDSLRLLERFSAMRRMDYLHVDPRMALCLDLLCERLLAQIPGTLDPAQAELLGRAVSGIERLQELPFWRNRFMAPASLRARLGTAQ